jgi:hypothetical protein
MKKELKKQREYYGDADEQYHVMQEIFEKYWK